MERKQIRLDDQAERDVDQIQRHYSLRSRSAAIRFALREVARQIKQEDRDDRSQATVQTDDVRASH